MEESQKPVSIRDIARLAGVSTATVSRVMNNTGRFSEETRQRVLKIVEENGYVANAAAKNLREARSKTVGLIVPDIANDFYSNLAFHVEQAFAQEGYSVFVCSTKNDEEAEWRYLRTLASKQVDGIVCIGGSSALGEAARQKHIPMVCVDRYPVDGPSVSRVISDDVTGGYIAMKHLLEQGCRSIVILAKIVKHASLERMDGYLNALHEYGLSEDRRYTLVLPGVAPSLEETDRLVSEFLQSGLPIDGICAGSDHYAAAALPALKRAGLRMPEDVKVIGYDDSVYARITDPQLSSVRRFPEDMARRGCRMLLDLIEGREVPEEEIVPVELVVRGSTVAQA